MEKYHKYGTCAWCNQRILMVRGYVRHPNGDLMHLKVCYPQWLKQQENHHGGDTRKDTS